MGTIALMLLVSGEAAAAMAPPHGVVLVTIDTMRVDHLGCYRYERPTSPFLDRLAREGALFENAIAASSMTAPCHASLFTGLYPLQHAIRINDRGFVSRSQRRFRTLAEELGAAGYTTAAFSAVGFMRSISQGFHTLYAGSGGHPRDPHTDAPVDNATP